MERAEYSVTPVAPAATPTVTSPTATAVGSTTATLGANVTSNGGAALTANGTCWGSTASPTTNCVDQGSHATGVFTQSRTGLTEGSLIYYRGYATNSAGTGYSPDGTIYTEPTQPTTLSFTSVGGAGITVNWATGSSGNAKNVIVVMKSGSAVNADPVDGTTYTANAAFGSGTQIGTLNYVVYKGTGTSVAVTGLSPSTTYYVKVYAFAAGASGTENYNITSPLAGSQATSTPTAPTLASPTATAIGSTTATLGANVTSNGGAAITARGTVWGTTANPTGNAVAEGGTATGIFTHARTGLTAGTKIYYRGYATNSAGTGYSPDGSFYTEPSTQASGVNFTAVGTTGMTVNWTRGNGDGVIVLMKQGSAVNSDPADGTYTGYTANPVFGSGTQIGTGNYVVYKGTGTSVAVTGLTAGTTYYLAVYEYKGTVDTSGVNQGTNYKPTPVTGSQATIPGGGPHTFTFNYIGAATQSLTIPAGATNIQFSVKGAGGGGGREDGEQNQENGQNGHQVVRSYSTSGVTLSIYVGGGGAEGSPEVWGASGGWGYQPGGYGGYGEDNRPDTDDYAYGGAGGGGSSAILLGATKLTEAAGGAGGRSSDWDGSGGCDPGYCEVFVSGGSGGAGGGSDYPVTTSSTGGGAGGGTATLAAMGK